MYVSLRRRPRSDDVGRPRAGDHVTTGVVGMKRETENDRFKRSFGSWFWGSMITATVFHFMLFQFWPTQTAEDVSFTAEEVELIELPPGN